MNVLIADENTTIRRNLVMIFKALSPNMRVVEVLNGKSALHALTQNTYGFIVTELDMTGGSGEVFIKHLVASKLLRHKPIIVYSNKEFDDTGLENIIYVHKELTPVSELGKIIKELMFKHYACPKCPEAIDGEPCLDNCFYKTLDNKWQEKLKDIK